MGKYGSHYGQHYQLAQQATGSAGWPYRASIPFKAAFRPLQTPDRTDNEVLSRLEAVTHVRIFDQAQPIKLRPKFTVFENSFCKLQPTFKIIDNTVNLSDVHILHVTAHFEVFDVKEIAEIARLARIAAKANTQRGNLNETQEDQI